MSRMINLVVVAGGKQTRFRDLSIFPKVLLPSATSCSILSELVDKTRNSEVPLKRWIVINKQYSEQVKTYIRVNSLQAEIEVIESTNTNGSFNTLREVKGLLPSENVLFIWSDLSLDDFSGVLKRCNDCSDDGILFTRAGQYRYNATGHQQDGTSKRRLASIQCLSTPIGNVPGLYFLKNLALLDSVDFKSDEVKDLVDAIDAIDGRSFEICDLCELSTELIEYRDLDVYKRCIRGSFKANHLQTRFFNSLVVNPSEKTMTKRAVDPDYAHLIKKEISWYTKYESLAGASEKMAAPRVHDFTEDSFTMDYLVGYEPLHIVLDLFESNLDITKIYKLYHNVLAAVDDVTGASSLDVSFETFKRDLRKEVVTKVIDRCEKIKAFLLNYKREDLEAVLEEAFARLVVFAVDSPDYDIERGTLKYWFCHGDLNGSNILVNRDTLDVKFVDPRGYFGETKLYGWRPYEHAKLLYCLYGYDDFNTKPQIYGEDWPKLRSSLEYSRFRDERFARDGKSYKSYQMLVGVIYVALAGYISQDIMKANIAYDYGMRILKWVLGRED